MITMSLARLTAYVVLGMLVGDAGTNGGPAVALAALAAIALLVIVDVRKAWDAGPAGDDDPPAGEMEQAPDRTA